MLKVTLPTLQVFCVLALPRPLCRVCFALVFGYLAAREFSKFYSNFTFEYSYCEAYPESLSHHMQPSIIQAKSVYCLWVLVHLLELFLWTSFARLGSYFSGSREAKCCIDPVPTDY